MSDKMEPGPIFLLMVRGMEYFLSVSVCVSVYLPPHQWTAAGAANVAMLAQVPDPQNKPAAHRLPEPAETTPALASADGGG